MSVLESGVFLFPPLSHKGKGPGMIIIVPDNPLNQLVQINGIPSPSLKWAKEGYTVLEIQESAIDRGYVLDQAIATFAQHDRCTPHDLIGLVVYGSQLWEKAKCLAGFNKVTAAAVYLAAGDDVQFASNDIPTVQHVAGKASWKLRRTESIIQYEYPEIQDWSFALPSPSEFNCAEEGVSHTRNLTFLKRHMNGPYFDLEAIWKEHTYFEFGNRSAEQTMSTMVQEPYVNHIPTVTGGIGRDKLTRFYRDNFIFTNPRDVKNQLISRTVGIDRVVDEFIMTFTHDSEVDWLILGISPTGCKLEIPFMAVVNIRGDRLYHEHITWDQGTVLKQLDLISEYLPYPYPISGGKGALPGMTFEVQVPVAGSECAAKMRDKNAIPSNLFFGMRLREGGLDTNQDILRES
ncbi:LEA domain protein [Aspergillus steynii IBT 23096]|uniref:LEA domain protein n=1 Tax=Aspergillus steynii IBT 23096 TaxID=1392250 RepID=A0A2I2FWF1_9EURO|nr:LEA domain protein [Aspergillus steynii IBT 23096]PLB44945.1 LEA domain protein [Aspergillus steynii IBT 23096]